MAWGDKIGQFNIKQGKKMSKSLWIWKVENITAAGTQTSKLVKFHDMVSMQTLLIHLVVKITLTHHGQISIL